jgi:hypothetical protein
MLTSVKARSAVWGTEFGRWLSVSTASFVNRPSYIAYTTVVTIMNDNYKTHT